MGAGWVDPDEYREPNDLHDMHFLACAAAYADVVVGEKRTIDHLGLADRRCVSGARLCRTLPEVHEHLVGLEGS